jgi:hypothetical protein
MALILVVRQIYAYAANHTLGESLITRAYTHALIVERECVCCVCYVTACMHYSCYSKLNKDD